MDTIILKIRGPQKFRFRNKSLFIPELTHRKYEDLSPTEIKSARNSSHQYLRKFFLHSAIKDEYIPSVEIFETLAKKENKVLYVMKITFSAPKLLFWNSIQEVGDRDEKSVIRALRYSLERTGIILESETIENAHIEAVHFCKNIPLPKNVRMWKILDELTKIDINKVIDITDRKQKIGGRVLNLYSGIIEYVFYDKIFDSQKTKNKRSDKNHIIYERGTVEKYKLQDREIFRYEYRIKKTQTVKSRINKILERAPETPIIFSDLFVPNLHKNIIIQSWNNLIQRPENQLALFETINRPELLLHIFSKAKEKNKSAYGMNNAFISYGIATAIKDHGVKEIRRLICEGWNKDHPERLTKKIKLASELLDGLSYSNNIAFINESIKKFELINLTSLEKGI